MCVGGKREGRGGGKSKGVCVGGKREGRGGEVERARVCVWEGRGVHIDADDS